MTYKRYMSMHVFRPVVLKLLGRPVLVWAWCLCRWDVSKYVGENTGKNMHKNCVTPHFFTFSFKKARLFIFKVV